MASEYITLHRTFAEHVWEIPPDSLKVFLVLLVREEAQENLKLGLTITELARQSGLSVAACRQSLEWLSGVNTDYISLYARGKHHEIAVRPHWGCRTEEVKIPFTYDDKDEQKVEKKEAEVRHLERELTARTNKERSGLVDVLHGDERNVVDEIERHQGRGFTPTEAYFLGQSVARFGPQRVQTTFRRSKSARNTVRAVFAILRNGALGKGAVERESQVERGVSLAEL